MTLRQYLAHLRSWLAAFPRPRADEHLTVGIAGSGEYQCLVCGAWEIVAEDDAEDAA